ncbi:MAG: TylF/MycF/NovP-related O-methyltransferase [candidate division FCPU426 bacterium]
MPNESQPVIHREMRPGFIGAARQALKYFGLTKAAALFLLLRAEEKKFIAEAATPERRRLRADLLARFKTIYRSILCLHFPFHFAQVAKFLLDLDVAGPIVECGSFKGGSSAQLSLIARATGRKLYVCDSFQGLPAPSKSEAKVKIFNDSRTHTYQEGDYAATLDEIKGNISRYGAIEVCEFVPGFFNRSLPRLNVKPAAIVLDVDLISSARDCLKSLWPRLKKGGYVFTHEAESETYMQGLMDKAWWKTHLKECPPLVFGAGSSLSPVAEGLALFRKG